MAPMAVGWVDKPSVREMIAVIAGFTNPVYALRRSIVH